MGHIRKVRLDEDSLVVLLSDGLRDAGFLVEGAKIVGLELRSRTIKAGGDYYRDPAEPGYAGPVEVVKWVRVMIEEPDRAGEGEP